MFFTLKMTSKASAIAALKRAQKSLNVATTKAITTIKKNDSMEGGSGKGRKSKKTRKSKKGK